MGSRYRAWTETEAGFLQAVRELARACGFLEYHTWRSIKSAPGFPDLVLVKPPRVIFAELKTDTGVPTMAQRQWLDALQQCPGITVYLWQPRNWDEIVHCLRG